jgi:predicted nucleotidyltransferase
LKSLLRLKKQKSKIVPIGFRKLHSSASPHANYCGKSLMDTIPLLPDFLELLKFLNEERVEYLVVGGMAVNYYGYHRSTGDLDIWVAISPENQDHLAAALIKFGFSPQAVSRRPLLQRPKFLRIGQPPLRVEIHSEIAGVRFEECSSRAEICSISGVDVRLISLKDLRINKAAAGRTKDQADLEALPDDV